MARMKQGAMVVSTLMLIAMIVSACNQPYSQQPSVTNTPIDPNSQAALNAGTIADLKQFVAKALDFVVRVYIPDLLAIASFYKDWAGHGRGGERDVPGPKPRRRH